MKGWKVNWKLQIHDFDSCYHKIGFFLQKLKQWIKHVTKMREKLFLYSIVTWTINNVIHICYKYFLQFRMYSSQVTPIVWVWKCIHSAFLNHLAKREDESVYSVWTTSQTNREFERLRKRQIHMLRIQWFFLRFSQILDLY